MSEEATGAGFKLQQSKDRSVPFLQHLLPCLNQHYFMSCVLHVASPDGAGTSAGTATAAPSASLSAGSSPEERLSGL